MFPISVLSGRQPANLSIYADARYIYDHAAISQATARDKETLRLTDQLVDDIVKHDVQRFKDNQRWYKAQKQTKQQHPSPKSRRELHTSATNATNATNVRSPKESGDGKSGDDKGPNGEAWLVIPSSSSSPPCDRRNVPAVADVPTYTWRVLSSLPLQAGSTATDVGRTVGGHRVHRDWMLCWDRDVVGDFPHHRL